MPMDPKPNSRWTRLRQRIELLVTDKGVSEEAFKNPVNAFFHFWMLTIRGFVANRCPVRATALAYTTLLALVPLLAVSLGVLSTLLKSDQDQTQELIERLVGQMAPQLEQLPGTEEEKLEAREQVIQEILSFIGNIHSGALGVTGTLALVFVAIGLLSTIEITFNDIWGVSRGRNWLSRVICYWTAITLGPLILLLAMGLVLGGQLLPANDSQPPAKLETVVPGMSAESVGVPIERSDGPVESARASSGEESLALRAAQRMVEGPLGRLMFQALPFLMLIGSFALLYQMMPNTQVQWRAAMVGALVGAVLWVLNSQFNVAFAARVVAASKIYGPLGVVPVFLIGLYVSWLIVLFGAQVAYAFQNRRAYLQEKLAEGISQRGREFVALRVMLAIARHFQQGLLPPSVGDMAAELGVSSRLVRQVVEPLSEAGLLLEINTPDSAYAPARPLEQISTSEILQALRSGRGQEPMTRAGAEREITWEVYGTVQRAEHAAAEPMTLQRLLERSRQGGVPDQSS